jgi:hypothetical protein
MANSARSPPATPCIKFLWRSETSVGLSIMSDPTLLPLIKPYVVNPIEGDWFRTRTINRTGTFDLCRNYKGA